MFFFWDSAQWWDSVTITSCTLHFEHVHFWSFVFIMLISGHWHLLMPGKASSLQKVCYIYFKGQHADPDKPENNPLNGCVVYVSVCMCVCVCSIFSAIFSSCIFSLSCMIRPHRSITYVDMAYCYQPSSVVCRSVCLSEPCKNSCTDRDAFWVEDLGGPKEPCIRWGSRSSHGKGQFWEGKGRPIVKYRDTLRSSVKKRLNRSRCHLANWLGWAIGIVC